VNGNNIYVKLTSTLVSHWTISNIAAFENGRCNLWLSSGASSCIRKHSSTEASWVLGNLFHLTATPVRNTMNSFGKLVFVFIF
jgi:hypothetical protein